MGQSWFSRETLTTKSSDVKWLDPKGLSSFPGLCSSLNLENWACTMPGVDGSSQLNQHSPWPSTNLKVSKLYLSSFHSNNFEFLGQTLKHVGIWLRSEVFTHGQLYVACSRVGKPEALKFAIRTEGKRNKEISNVVFKEVLLWFNQFFALISCLSCAFCNKSMYIFKSIFLCVCVCSIIFHFLNLSPPRGKAAGRLLWVSCI